MKIVCIGNSIVNGFPHKRSQCFASLWRQTSGHEIINKGVNGDITPNILARFEKDVIGHRPASVLILTGTNDFIYNICAPDEAMSYLSQMAELSKANSINVILLTPLLIDVSLAESYWLAGTDYHTVNEKLKVLRELMLEYGNKNGVMIIDAQNLFQQLYTEETVTDYLLDGIHPTVLGHEAIARFLPD